MSQKVILQCFFKLSEIKSIKVPQIFWEKWQSNHLSNVFIMKPQNMSHWGQEEIYLVIELSFLHEFGRYLYRQNEGVHYCETYYITRVCMIRVRVCLAVEVKLI